VSQIHKRGREYESGIRIDYLSGLNDRYEEWIADYKDGKIMIIDVDENKFEERPEDLSIVIDRIDAQLHGLF
jgi:deoxyadenosine/deoxycytidine kinase